jgi:hypothetical protein
MGTFGNSYLPFASGTVDSGRISTNMLGAPYQFGAETYILVQCLTGTDIATGSNGKLLVTTNTGIGSVTAGPSWKVGLSTGVAEPLIVGAVPSTLTQAISGAQYFMALRDSPAHALMTRPLVTGGTGGIASGSILMSGSGSDLIAVFTAATTITAAQNDVINTARAPAVSLESLTAIVTASGLVAFHAPFRAAQ